MHCLRPSHSKIISSRSAFQPPAAVPGEFPPNVVYCSKSGHSFLFYNCPHCAGLQIRLSHPGFLSCLCGKAWGDADPLDMCHHAAHSWQGHAACRSLSSSSWLRGADNDDMKGSAPLLRPLLRPLLTETPIDLERICPRQPKNVSSRICRGRCSTRCFSHQRENHWTQNTKEWTQTKLKNVHKMD